MQTTNKRSYIIVSLFILIGLVIFLAAVFTLGGKQKRFVKTIEVKTTMDDVSGLIAGNNVWFSGVKVGTVKSVDFLGNSQVDITMNIVASAQQFIHKDSRTKLSSEGLIGNRIIVITDGSLESPVIKDGDRLGSLEVVSSDQIMETLQANNNNLVTVTGNLKELSEKILNGEGALGAVLQDKAMAQDLKALISNLSYASEGVNKAAGNISYFTSKMNNGKGSVNRILADTGMYLSMQKSLKQLQLASENAYQLSRSLKSAGENLDSGESAAGVLLNDKETAVQLKSLIGNLESSSVKLDDNLEAMQHNFLLRGFFKKKEKEQDPDRKD
jgi:phospholipid/cholesterol/gamma-HCH transport system substrate-binding protein